MVHRPIDNQHLTACGKCTCDDQSLKFDREKYDCQKCKKAWEQMEREFKEARDLRLKGAKT